MIGTVFLASTATVTAGLVFLTRIMGWRRVLKNATIIDVIFTVGATLALAGTLTGVLTGIVAGLLMTGVLTAARAVQDTVAPLFARDITPAAEAEDWCPGGTADRL